MTCSGRGSEFHLTAVRAHPPTKSNNFKNNYDPGQAAEGSMVCSVNCDRCWHLD